MSSQNYTPELFSSTSETSTEPAHIAPQAAADKPVGSKHKKFIEALSIQGKARRTLIETVKPAHLYYKARALWLQYKSGNFTKEAAQHWAANNKEIAEWRKLSSTINQDAFAALLHLHAKLSSKFDLFRTKS